MGIERIGDIYDNGKVYTSIDKYCHNPEHNPPNMINLPPGKYRYTCPGCGKVSNFDIYPEGSWL
jgi:hypothetical protein